jgi:hypothetical protein
MTADPRWQETASKGILLGKAPGVEGAYLVYPGCNRKVLVRKQVVVMEARAAAQLPCFSDRFQLGDSLLAEDTVPQADSAADAEAAGEPVASRTRGQSAVGDRDGSYHSQLADSESYHAERAQSDGDNYWPSAVCTRETAEVGARRGAVEAACSAAMLEEGEEEEAAYDNILSGRLLPKAPRSIAEALASPYAAEWKAALDKELGDCLGGKATRESARDPSDT